MKSNIQRIRICWITCSKILKNSVFVVYNTGAMPRTYLFDSLLDLPTTVLNYYMECLEKNKYKFTGQSFSKTTGAVRTYCVYDNTFPERWFYE